MICRLALACLLTAALGAPAIASPWAEVGDQQLRSDIEILAAAGMIDGITTHWPLPWASIVSRLRSRSGSDQPAYVREAADRVLAVAQHELRTGDLRVSAWADGTNRPDPVRGFDGMGRETVQGQVEGELMGPTTAVRLAIGAQVRDKSGRTDIMPDGSYIAQKLAGVMLYGGYVTHWWGPGWISALSLSNNARPMPQIGISRSDTAAFQTPFLSWLGPWQAEFVIGWMDDSRIATNTLFDGLRFTFNPLPGLEIGLARTQELCGEGHPCVPLKYYFEFANDQHHLNHTNDEGVIDLKYSTMLGGSPVQAYMQLMNEDSNPITHSATSHLFGASTWLPLMGRPLRLTAEYTDTVPTLDIFSFGDVLHGAAYNNSTYRDGLRYRGRSLGFSLDSDSTLFTLQGAWTSDDGIGYEVTWHHAAISNPHNSDGNVVTSAPVHLDIGEARVTLPFHRWDFDIAARIMSDQPRPRTGSEAVIEGAIRYNL